MWLPPTGIYILHHLLNSVVCPPFNPALRHTLISMFLLLTIFSPDLLQCSVFFISVQWKCSSTQHTHFHSHDCSIKTSLKINTDARTHLLVMPSGPQLLKMQAVREKGQRSMLAVDSYYSPILSFSQDQMGVVTKWEQKEREKEILRERARDTHHTHLSKSDRQIYLEIDFT